MREEPVLGKQIIRQHRASLQLQAQGLLLTVATEQEENLRLKRIACAVTVEVGEEGIFFEGFEH